VARPPPRHGALLPPEMFAGDLQLSGVTYCYPGRDTPALQDVTVRLPRNRITALVGESGAGKSTLLDILLGLLKPERGQFTVGDTLITAANNGDWQDCIGYVPQEIFLIDDTLLANICFGHHGVPDRERALRAAALARLDGLVATLPGGLDGTVGENGSLLSGGQRQRVAIARALYGEPSLLVMDEATSALDGLTEREIMNTVAQLRSVATVVLVAHRASTIRYADHIVIVRAGRIDDSGDYAQVMARDSSLREMMTAQDIEPVAVA
jgi:HlyD family secretion protein